MKLLQQGYNWRHSTLLGIRTDITHLPGRKTLQHFIIYKAREEKIITVGCWQIKARKVDYHSDGPSQLVDRKCSLVAGHNLSWSGNIKNIWASKVSSGAERLISQRRTPNASTGSQDKHYFWPCVLGTSWHQPWMALMGTRGCGMPGSGMETSSRCCQSLELPRSKIFY